MQSSREKPPVVMIEVRQYQNKRYRTVGTLRLYNAKAPAVLRKLKKIFK